MATQGRSEKFVKDLIIAGDDGKLYYLSEAEWKQHEVPISSCSPVIQAALRSGVAVAAVPETDEAAKPQQIEAKGKPVHTLGFCYLLSLASLRTHTSFEK